MTCRESPANLLTSTTGPARRGNEGSLRVMAIIDAVLSLPGPNTSSELDTATGTRRFTSSMITPEPVGPHGKDATGQAPARGRRRAETPRARWLNILFPRRP